ncbi:MAG: glycosyl hydrolase-related protein [Gemmatimonadetes bacterium]|nr:glycosyl hydrolase-related protein [Gemmatimonadota bacterium]
MRRTILSRGIVTAVAFAAAASSGRPAGVRAQEPGEGTAQDRPIPDWLVLGTFPVEPGPQRVTHPYLADEATAAPEPDATVGDLTWHEVKSDTLGRMDLKVAIGTPPLEQAAAYAFSWVTSPDERTVTFGFESDDDLRVWLDGTLILDREVARSLRGGTDTVTVRLARGANRLLMKVVNRTGGFGLGARLLGIPGSDLDGIRLGVTVPEDAEVATTPQPALTVGPLSIASSAVLVASSGEIRVPTVARGTRWGGLSGPVRVRVGGQEAALPGATDGLQASVDLPTTWGDLTAAAAAGDAGVQATVAEGDTYGHAIDPGPVMDVLARPIGVEGWRWRDGDGMWHALPAAGDHGVDPAVVRETRALAFRSPVPAVLAGLSLDMDAAEFGATSSSVKVGGVERPIGADGRVVLCAPCRMGDTLSVEVDPAGQWWNAPRLVVPDAGWMEISQGARWARFFLADSVAPGAPGPDVARELLAASTDPGKGRYRGLVSEWMQRLAPAARTIKADTIDIVGNAHIDAAWLWRWPETVDVVRNTWRTAAELLEKYPGTTFAGSAAVFYEWVAQYEPSLLTKLQRLQKEGRWALVGGWWVEADANLPSGEAFVRQGLYGQRAYQALFGTTARVAWIPDTFGYAFSLPQIFKKEGMDFFVTQKLRWNDTDKWSADKNLFWWEGRDGSRVLTYIPYGYTHDLGAQSLADEWKASRDSTVARRMLVLYGVGDHGGGPTMEMLDRARQLERIPTFPALRSDLPVDAMERMAKEATAAPVIHDELYLEYHRGVYTTQSNMKLWNRRMEGLLGATEVAATHASFVAPSSAWYNYPRGALTTAWEKTLFNQFHDLLPGSGIAPIYQDAMADYHEAERVTLMELDRAGEMIAGTLDTRSPVQDGRPYVALNPSGHARSGVVAIPWTEGAAGAVDGDGHPLSSGVWEDTLRVRVEDVPATGARLLWVVPGTSAQGEPLGALLPEPGGRAVLQNEKLRVEVERGTGEIARIVDKASGRDALEAGGGGNRLATRRDQPLEWDAWNLDNTDDPWIPVADTVRVGEPGHDHLGTFVDVVRADGNGRFEQRITLPNGESRVEVDTRALWRADHRVLKASFPLAVAFDSTWAEIPYGAIERPAVPLSRQDSARYEVSMQRWVDASDGTWGVSLVNDSKHGYDVRGDTLRLTLLKAPKWPDSTADMGWHHFRYDVVVHDGDWRSGPTEEVADDLNQPLRAVAVPVHDGQGRARAFLTLEGVGVELGALKMAEDGEDLVVRLVERHGAPSTATLQLPWPFEWREADLLERPEKESGWTRSAGDRVSIRLQPWEIATVLVRPR